MKKIDEASNLEKTDKDSLEISSTGYGYESVENVSVENPNEIQKDSKSSCGGL